MNKKIYFVIYLILCSSILMGQNEYAGTRGFAFMKVNYSARAMGMANAFTALSNDGDAVFFNTAGLAQNDNEHIKTTYINYLEGLQGGSVVYTTRYQEEWVVAPFIKFMASDAIPKTIAKQNEQHVVIPEERGTFNTFSMVTGAGFARVLNEHFDLGFNLFYFYEKLDSYTASAIALDFGVLHQTNNENLKLGVSLRNIGMQLSYFTEDEYNEQLPSMFTAGASYRLADKGFVNFDLVRPFDNDFFGRLGIEFYYNTYFTIRAGLDSRMEDYKTGESMDFLSGVTFGLGFNWNKHMIDYSISSMGGLGFVNQISVSYLF